MKRYLKYLLIPFILSVSSCVVEPIHTRVWIHERYIYYPDGSAQFVPGHWEYRGENTGVVAPIGVGVGIHVR